jgi:tRNA A-37 threonylcarbamoyl transferase component Bud32
MLARLARPESLFEPPARLFRRIPPNPASQTARIPSLAPGSPALYVKRSRPPSGWRAIKDFFRASRSRRAFMLALRLQSLGVAAAMPVAAGEERRGHWLKRELLVTEEVDGALNWQELDEQRGSTVSRVSIVRGVAHCLAQLHNSNLIHLDAVRPNFMIRNAGAPRAEVILVDLDGIAWRRMTRRRSARNTMATMRRNLLTPRERLWFVVQYCRSRTPRIPSRAWRQAVDWAEDVPPETRTPAREDQDPTRARPE